MKACYHCKQPIRFNGIAVQKVRLNEQTDRMNRGGPKVVYCSMLCAGADLNEIPVKKVFQGVKEQP